VRKGIGCPSKNGSENIDLVATGVLFSNLLDRLLCHVRISHPSIAIKGNKLNLLAGGRRGYPSFVGLSFRSAFGGYLAVLSGVIGGSM
jgi:hypothetical protein